MSNAVLINILTHMILNISSRIENGSEKHPSYVLKLKVVYGMTFLKLPPTIGSSRAPLSFLEDMALYCIIAYLCGNCPQHLSDFFSSNF